MLTTLILSAALSVSPPRVVSASPDMADVGVDPALKEIVIEFDQEMSPGGRSICGGGGETFPKMDGELRWVTTKRLIIPVKLAPGKMYSLSINCPSARGFRGVNGESAEAYPISFRTRGENEGTPVLTKGQAAGAWAKLRTAINERYSYKELRAERGLDWNKVFEEHGPLIAEARTPSELAQRAAKMLRATEDLHITVRVAAPGMEEPFVLAAGRREVTPNVDVRSLAKKIEGWTSLGKHGAGGVYKEIPYLLVTDWGGTGKEYVPIFEFLEKHKGSRSFIIDVRPNSGGDEAIARKLAGWFVEKPAVYSRSKIRDPQQNGGESGGVGGWSPVHDRVVTPTGEHALSGARVAVLIGAANMSSCESFVLMMRHGANGRATLIGDKTFGSSGRPMPVELSSSVTVLLPSWVDYAPDGTVVEGRGVEPDIAVDFVGKGGADEVFERAVKELGVE